MHRNYEKDLDLNLLRVFLVVGEEGSVTRAAARLYLTQPAVSAALKRLQVAVGATLFSRAGRGLRLTARGRRLLLVARPHVEGLLAAALSPATFDPVTSDRTIRLGLSDASEGWLLAPLLRALDREAPRIRVIVVPVQFRTIGPALAAGAVDLAVTVADELGRDVARDTLFTGGFVCLYDPRHARFGQRLTRTRYLGHEHVIVSYNGDLRGVVEDALGLQRRVRVSVPTFHGLGAILEGSALLATVPALVAQDIVRTRPRLRTTALPFVLPGAAMELLWPRAADDDEAVRFLRGLIQRIARQVQFE